MQLERLRHDNVGQNAVQHKDVGDVALVHVGAVPQVVRRFVNRDLQTQRQVQCQPRTTSQEASC